MKINKKRIKLLKKTLINDNITAIYAGMVELADTQDFADATSV